METFDFLMQGFGVAMLPKNLLIALIGAFIGTVVGMLPGNSITFCLCPWSTTRECTYLTSGCLSWL